MISLIAFTLMIDQKPVKFLRNAEQKLTLSADCYQKSKTEPKCDAERITRPPLKKLSAAELNYKNPGAAYCIALNGSVVIGIDPKQNQQSFCKFKDGSLIDNASLAWRAGK